MIPVTASPSQSICLFSSLSAPSLSCFLFLHPCLPAPAPSLCPRRLPDEEKLMPEFIMGLRLLPAPLGCSAPLCGGGAWCFKGTVYHAVPPPPRFSPVFSSLLASLLPHYLHSRCLSSLCHSFIEGVISLLNQDEVFLCRQPSSLWGRGVQKSRAVTSLIYKAGWCLMTSSD